MKNFNKYLLNTDIDKKWGLYVTTAGYTKIDKGQRYPVNESHPKTHAFSWENGRILGGFYLVYIAHGSGVFESEKSGSESISAGDCFFLFPQVWHRYKPDRQSGWEEYWIGFDGDYAWQLVPAFFPAEQPEVSVGHNKEFLELMLRLLECISEGKPGYQQIISGMLLQLLAILKTSSELGTSIISAKEKLINEAKFLLRESIESNAGIAQILKRLPVSYSTLRKDFKAIAGVSPNQYLLDQKIEKAKELLSKTTLSLGEIASQSGFESLSYLSKTFKRRCGVSPQGFRKG